MRKNRFWCNLEEESVEDALARAPEVAEEYAIELYETTLTLEKLNKKLKEMTEFPGAWIQALLAEKTLEHDIDSYLEKANRAYSSGSTIEYEFDDVDDPGKVIVKDETGRVVSRHDIV